MKILVLGENGMLGREVVQEGRLREHHMLYANFDITYSAGLALANRQLQPDVVINCAGVIPSKANGESPVRMLLVNAIGPHNVVRWFPDSHIIHVSTDCVFSGLTEGPHTTDERPDPVDIYGRSKLAGEPSDARCTTVRTSFIGYAHGLLPWFLDATGVVDGWANVRWSGSTVYDVARELILLAEGDPSGLVHLAAPPLSKFDVLDILREAFNKDINIRRVSEPRIDRSLEPTRYLLPLLNTVGELVRRRP